MLMPLPFPTEGSNPSLYDARQTFPLVYYANCICNFIHILRNSPKGRHKVVIVGEELGY